MSKSCLQKSMEAIDSTLERTIGVAFSYGELIGTVGAICVGCAAWTLLLLYIFLRATTIVEPNLERANSEKVYSDPTTGEKHPFPSVTDPLPSVYITLVVPAYNEQDRMPVMMEETMEYLEKRRQEDDSFTYEVVIVNDGSKDDTTEVAMKYVKQYGTERVRVLEFVKNRGKGGAVRMGSLSARGERVLFLDADGATKIADMKRLEEAMDDVAEDYNMPAIVVGSRAHLQDEAIANRSLFRNFLMYGFHFLVYILCVKGIKDTQCGFKMMTRSAAATLFQIMHIDRWAFDVELLYVAQQLKMPMKEVSVNWQEIEGSKLVPFWSWLQMGRDLLFIRLRYMFGLWTLHPPRSKTY